MPYEPPPDLAGLSLGEIAELTEARKLPPVDQWRPEQTGDSLMRIAADGRWFHDGGEITRPAMVRGTSTSTRMVAGSSAFKKKARQWFASNTMPKPVG